ncbi:917_t:CDS:2 [Entrophospora sp. SA101]|nr:917_t:CDS:2 [Entrophospora sp. SA101]CAJ0864592.1 8770_t:CDS:2 [Entrophospora sp. SA101]
MIDANEATQCTFIESILHASIAIARRDTNKEIDILYQLDISGEEATCQVDYAISEMEDLLCITEGKPQYKNRVSSEYKAT